MRRTLTKMCKKKTWIHGWEHFISWLTTTTITTNITTNTTTTMMVTKVPTNPRLLCAQRLGHRSVLLESQMNVVVETAYQHLAGNLDNITVSTYIYILEPPTVSIEWFCPLVAPLWVRVTRLGVWARPPEIAGLSNTLMTSNQWV